MVAFTISITVVFISGGILFFDHMQEMAEERRIIAEQEEEEQRLHEEAEAERQAAINLIEERINEGYDSWTELITWAEDENISWYFSENGEIISGDLMDNIVTYGISGTYITAEIGEETQADLDEIVLLLSFENLSYQEVIAELSQLNKDSLEELEDWLDDDGLERLAAALYEVSVIDVDKEGIEITEEPEYGKSFSSWNIEIDHLVSEQTSIQIERKYDLVTSRMEQIRVEAGISPLRSGARNEEVQDFVISMLNAIDKNEYIRIGQVRHSSTGDTTLATTALGYRELADLFEIDRELLEGHVTFDRHGINRVNPDGDSLNRDRSWLRITGELDESTFISWDFEYSSNSRIGVSITIVHDAQVGKVTLDRFNMIEDGMTLDEVREIFGLDGGLSSASGNVEIHEWLDGQVLITFTNGVVTAKAQSGL